MTPHASVRYWAVVPAAGTGRRLGAEIPKQYLRLAGQTVLEHTLDRLCGHPRIERVVVALRLDDPYWARCRYAQHPAVVTVLGGAERCHSVLNGLMQLAEAAQPNDWVLVHDAARPCLRSSDINRLIEELADHPVGGLLALPVSDTVKRANAQGEVAQTVSREDLWRAFTPQMFRFEALSQALNAAVAAERRVTDEAQALELAGFAPRLVEGQEDNIKITRADDMNLAEYYLRRQEARR